MKIKKYKTDTNIEELQKFVKFKDLNIDEKCYIILYIILFLLLGIIVGIILTLLSNLLA